MKKIIGLTLLLALSSVRADELTNKIRIGTGHRDVESIMGDKPYDTDCSITLGIKSCKLFFKRADFDKNGFTAYFYEIVLIAERVFSTNVQTKRGIYK